MDCGGFCLPHRKGIGEGKGEGKGLNPSHPTPRLPNRGSPAPAPPPKAGVNRGQVGTGGGGRRLGISRNPSGFLPLHFFCNKPCYCAVLGKLIGARWPAGSA